MFKRLNRAYTSEIDCFLDSLRVARATVPVSVQYESSKAARIAHLRDDKQSGMSAVISWEDVCLK